MRHRTERGVQRRVCRELGRLSENELVPSLPSPSRGDKCPGRKGLEGRATPTWTGHVTANLAGRRWH